MVRLRICRFLSSPHKSVSFPAPRGPVSALFRRIDTHGPRPISRLSVRHIATIGPWPRRYDRANTIRRRQHPSQKNVFTAIWMNRPAPAAPSPSKNVNCCRAPPESSQMKAAACLANRWQPHPLASSECQSASFRRSDRNAYLPAFPRWMPESFGTPSTTNGPRARLLNPRAQTGASQRKPHCCDVVFISRLPSNLHAVAPEEQVLLYTPIRGPQNREAFFKTTSCSHTFPAHDERCPFSTSTVVLRFLPPNQLLGVSDGSSTVLPMAGLLLCVAAGGVASFAPEKNNSCSRNALG